MGTPKPDKKGLCKIGACKSLYRKIKDNWSHTMCVNVCQTSQTLWKCFRIGVRKKSPKYLAVKSWIEVQEWVWAGQPGSIQTTARMCHYCIRMFCFSPFFDLLSSSSLNFTFHYPLTVILLSSLTSYCIHLPDKQGFTVKTSVRSDGCPCACF